VRRLLCAVLSMVCAAQQPVIKLSPGGARARLIPQEPAVYPETARERNVHGVVRLAIEVDEDGRVVRSALISGHPVLVGAAMKAVRKYRYRPIEARRWVTSVEVGLPSGFVPLGDPPTVGCAARHGAVDSGHVEAPAT